MDNLGIFKLLSSAYEFYQKNKSKQKETANEEKQQSENDNFLSKILNFKNAESNEREASVPKRAKEKPLQYGMLSTMRSHEEFVQRVLKSNNKK